MKNSGVPWLGKVPDHWEIRRAKTIFHGIDVRSSTGEEELLTVSSERGVVPRRSANVTMFKAESYLGYKLCWPNDLVINSLWAWARGLGVSRYHGIVSSAYGVYRLRPPFESYSGFVHELVRSTPFQWELQVRSKGIWTSRLQLTDEAFFGAPFPIPPPTEHTAIVRFLDWADRRIRRVIRARQRRIKLLEEYKQVLIHRAVTGQIDVRRGKPYPAYKPSGVEWLGDVPEHWEVKRLKWVTRLQRGYDLPAEQRIRGSFPVVSSGGIIGTHCEARSKGPGVVVGRYGSTDAVFFIEPDFWPHNTALFVTDFQGNRPRWCFFMLRTISKADHSGKSAVPGVDRKDLFEINIAVPPVGEQDLIVVGIENAMAELEGGVAADRRAIDLLKEFRTRLIADVVTGKLDVREVAARLADEPGAEEPEALEEVEEQVEGENESEGVEMEAASEEGRDAD
jgi:type I restriction enzyme, S subunit